MKVYLQIRDGGTRPFLGSGFFCGEQLWLIEVMHPVGLGLFIVLDDYPLFSCDICIFS